MRFATSDLPREWSDTQRAAAWTEALGGDGGQFEMRTPRVDGFFGAVELKVWGELQVGSALTTSADLVRTPARIGHDGDRRILLVVNRGHSVIRARQHGREAEIRPGGMALFDLGSVCECLAPEGGHLIHALVPRASLNEFLISEASGRSLDGRSEAGRLLRDLLGDLLRRDLEAPGLAEATIAYVASLVRIIVEGATGIMEPPRAINRMRLRRARDLIEARFGEAAFGVSDAAAAIGVSPRHLQSLFARGGETFSDCLAARRLDAAYMALRGVADLREPIPEIAERCGFSDISTFYRRFSARYGQSPARVRAEHGLSSQAKA